MSVVTEAEKLILRNQYLILSSLQKIGTMGAPLGSKFSDKISVGLSETEHFLQEAKVVR